MVFINPVEMYKEIKHGGTKYDEKTHCPMILEIYPPTGRLSAFCAKARITEQTFYNWVNKHVVMRECYQFARVLAREDWEQEYQDNKDDDMWDKKYWQLRGSRYLAKENGAKIMLDIDENADPWVQYTQILKQTKNGHFTASEVKQLMESVNIGTRVHESFKLQQEVDKMKEDLTLMANRNGNNIVSIAKTA